MFSISLNCIVDALLVVLTMQRFEPLDSSCPEFLMNLSLDRVRDANTQRSNDLSRSKKKFLHKRQWLSTSLKKSSSLLFLSLCVSFPSFRWAFPMPSIQSYLYYDLNKRFWVVSLLVHTRERAGRQCGSNVSINHRGDQGRLGKMRGIPGRWQPRVLLT